MPSVPELHPVGQHLLGPHVVGQRIVLRHLLRGLTGPTGGPALNDVLGVCTAWGPDTVTVDADRGPVTVPIADIVSGKPVPPRPSVRHRASPTEAEAHVLSLFDDVEALPLGEWTLRAAGPYGGRLLRRANSALAMGDPGLPLPEAAAAVRAFYAERDRAPVAQVLTGSAVHDGLLALDWTALPDGDAHCQLAAVSRALRSATALVRGLDGPPARLDEEGERAHVTLGGGTATGRAALDGDWVGIHSVAVDPGQRRRGLATVVVAELLDWAASRGATTAWLHVQTANEPAQRLYRRLGFVTHHTYRYLSG